MFSHPLLSRRSIPALAIGSVLLIGSTAACGSSDSFATPSDSLAPSGDRQCEPVNVDLEATADQTVNIGANDFAFDQLEYRARAGTVTFTMSNDGKAEHELAFLPGGGEIPTADDQPDEAALEAAGAFELEAFGPGQTCNATYQLDAGTYTLFCIVQTDDGQTHYDKGMKSTLIVS